MDESERRSSTDPHFFVLTSSVNQWSLELALCILCFQECILVDTVRWPLKQGFSVEFRGIKHYSESFLCITTFSLQSSYHHVTRQKSIVFVLLKSRYSIILKFPIRFNRSLSILWLSAKLDNFKVKCELNRIFKLSNSEHLRNI